MRALNELFAGRPLVCRLNSMAVPRSSVNWLPEEEFLERGANPRLELHDFIDRGLVSVLRALHEMIPLLTPHLTAKMSKRRHTASHAHVRRALDAATSQGSASNILTQKVLPIVSRTLAGQHLASPCSSATCTRRPRLGPIGSGGIGLACAGCSSLLAVPGSLEPQVWSVVLGAGNAVLLLSAAGAGGARHRAAC